MTNIYDVLGGGFVVLNTCFIPISLTLSPQKRESEQKKKKKKPKCLNALAHQYMTYSPITVLLAMLYSH